MNTTPEKQRRTPFEVGSSIGSYRIVAHLSAGGMATLLLARRAGAAGFARHVAIKVVHPHLAGDPSFIRMFVDEAKLAARIQHPNVVHVEELGEEGGTYFLVMEYVDGCSLAELLSSLARMQRRLSPDLATWIAMQLAEGLHAAHETKDERGQLLGVVHRDVSPQNVILAIRGHVKLIDFGIAKAKGRQHQTVTGSLKGKFRYMSPEQAISGKVDRRTDVYALGIVLWEMLAMRRMFEGNNDIELLDQVRAPNVLAPSYYSDASTPELDRTVLAALDPDPDRRPQSALELRRMLSQAVPGAAAVDSTQLAEVIDAVMGEEIEKRRRSLPESVSGLWQRSPTVELDGPPVDAESSRQEALKTHTRSFPGAQFPLDIEAPVDAAPSDGTHLATTPFARSARAAESAPSAGELTRAFGAPAPRLAPSRAIPTEPVQALQSPPQPSRYSLALIVIAALVVGGGAVAAVFWWTAPVPDLSHGAPRVLDRVARPTDLPASSAPPQPPAEEVSAVDPGVGSVEEEGAVPEAPLLQKGVPAPPDQIAAATDQDEVEEPEAPTDSPTTANAAGVTVSEESPRAQRRAARRRTSGHQGSRKQSASPTVRSEKPANNSLVDGVPIFEEDLQ